MGLGGFPAEDEQYLGMLGMHGTYEANMSMHNADVILALGARFDDRVTNTPSKFCPNAKIVHVDIDPASISKTVSADVPIVGPVKSVLEDMNKQLEEMLAKGEVKQDKAEPWVSGWKQIKEWRGYAWSYGLIHVTILQRILIKPQEAIETLWRVTNGEAFVCSDVGQHQMFAAQYYRFNKPRRWINSGGLGTMGFGLPSAMGAKLGLS